jgi:Skp family chaperone for outer membrane proteins
MLLLVRVADVLDHSAAGKAAAARLQRQYDDAKRDAAAIADAAERARFEDAAVRAIEAERARLREELLSRARAAAEQLRVANKADLVIDAGVVLAAGPGNDVTAELIARLDGGERS